MTSHKFNSRKAAAAAEMAVYDRLPTAIRRAINDAPCSVRARTILDALLRGVSEEAIIQSLKRSLKP